MGGRVQGLNSAMVSAGMRLLALALARRDGGTNYFALLAALLPLDNMDACKSSATATSPRHEASQEDTCKGGETQRLQSFGSNPAFASAALAVTPSGGSTCASSAAAFSTPLP